MSDLSRRLYLNPQLDRRAFLNDCPHRQVITTTSVLARQLGLHHTSLEQLANNAIAPNGLAVASPWQLRQLLVEAVAEVMPDADAAAVAQWLTPALRSLLKSGADLGEIAAVPKLGTKVYRTIAIAQNYRAKLQRRSLVDPAELFWQASAVQPDPQPLAILSLLDPDRDRLAFIDAIAGSGSCLALPCDESDWFHDSREAVVGLQSQGWELFWDIDEPLEFGSSLDTQTLITTHTGI